MENNLIVFLFISIFILCAIFSIVKPILLIIVPLFSYKIIYELIIIFNLTVGNSVATQTALRLSALVAGIFCILSIIFLIINKYSLYDKFLFPFFIFVNFIGFISGLIFSNDFVYNVGDFFNLFQIYIFSIILVYLFKKGHQDILIFSLIFFSLIADLFYFSQYSIMLFNGNFQRIMGGNIFLVLISFCLFFSNDTKYKKFYMISFFIPLLTLLFASYRGKWILVLLGIGLFLFLRQERKSFLTLFSTFIKSFTFIVLIFLVLYQLPTFKDYINKRIVQETIIAYQEDGDTESQSQKYYETFKVSQYFYNDPIKIFFGYGSGAEIQIDKGVGKYILKKWDSRGKLHYIHNTYFSNLFRYGLFGLIIFISTIFFLIRSSFRNLDRNGLHIFALVYLLIGVIGFSQDFMIGVYLGILEWSFIFSIIIYNNYKKAKDVQTV